MHRFSASFSWFVLAWLIAGTFCPGAEGAVAVSSYSMGNPQFSDLFVDPINGNDNNSGTSASSALKTLHAAWALVPSDTSSASFGYRLLLLPGNYPFEEGYSNYLDNRAGSYTKPIVITALNGRGSVTIEGGLNVANCQYLYLIDLNLIAGGSHQSWGNNVLHLEQCDHLLLRGLTVSGPDPVANPQNYDIQEVIKINQSQYVYLEDSDISGTYQTGVDYFCVQYGHVLSSRIHGAGEWCMYFKGGSAYLVIHGNQFYEAGLGFQAGEGSNLEVMRSPWFHYECYDIKFINNIAHHVRGTALSAAGVYNFLAAYNTFYKVGTNTGSPDYPLAQFVHGQRGLVDTSENGENNAETIAQSLLNQGAWGTAVLSSGRDLIPNRNVFMYNNLFYNPAPSQTAMTHLWVQEAVTPPADTRNIPSPSRCDDNLVIRGNVIWNGPAAHDLGIENSTFLTETQLRADNAINTVQPQLQDPENGNFHPAQTSNVFSAATYVIPDFGWTDAPSTPAVPAGNFDNTVTVDFAGQSRSSSSPCGAYASASGANPATSQPQLVGLTANITATPTTNQPVTFTATCAGGTPRYYKFWYITGYGTPAYNPNNAVVIQDFSSSTICTFAFPRADNYVVVVWAVTDPTSYDAASVPIIGLNVRVGD